MPRPVHAVLLAGGEGKRMKSPVPKVLLDLLGRPVLGHVLDAVGGLGARSRVVVGGRHLPALREAFGSEKRIAFVRQSKPLGTAHAVKQALKILPRQGADVLIVNGDGPLITTASLRALVDEHRRLGVDVTLVAARVADPSGLGRIVRGHDRRFLRIVEEKDATPEERALDEINSGQYVVRAEALHRLIPRIGRRNVQGEYYLTDIVALAQGSVSAFALADPDETRGINRPSEFAEVRRILKARVLAALAAQGATIVDPDLTYVETGVNVGEGTVIMPFVVIRRGVSIAPHCVVGPFAHLREGAVLEESSRVGNFVEMKQARLGARAKALHLAYLGDARIGSEVNVGAGTITANFDGREKHLTVVEDGAFLGSGTILVAPVKVGRGARTGAGAVVPARHDVTPGQTVVGVPARMLAPRSRPSPGRTRRKRT